MPRDRSQTMGRWEGLVPWQSDCSDFFPFLSVRVGTEWLFFSQTQNWRLPGSDKIGTSRPEERVESFRRKVKEQLLQLLPSRRVCLAPFPEIMVQIGIEFCWKHHFHFFIGRSTPAVEIVLLVRFSFFGSGRLSAQEPWEANPELKIFSSTKI